MNVKALVGSYFDCETLIFAKVCFQLYLQRKRTQSAESPSHRHRNALLLLSSHVPGSRGSPHVSPPRVLAAVAATHAPTHSARLRKLLPLPEQPPYSNLE